MGYYATGNGSIVFKVKPSRDQIDAVMSKADGYYQIGCDFCNHGNEYYVDIWYSEKYCEENVFDVLRFITETIETDCGEFVFSGEDNSQWRFIFRDGKWVEQYGEVVYRDF